jgi:hypothetical protein
MLCLFFFFVLCIEIWRVFRCFWGRLYVKSLSSSFDSAQRCWVLGVGRRTADGGVYSELRKGAVLLNRRRQNQTRTKGSGIIAPTVVDRTCLPSSSVKSTGIDAGQYSHKSCLQAPQEIPPSRVATARWINVLLFAATLLLLLSWRKCRCPSPSLRALNNAPLSPQHVRPKVCWLEGEAAK